MGLHIKIQANTVKRIRNKPSEVIQRTASVVPESTSAEGFGRFVGGKRLRTGAGRAWRDIKAWLVALPPAVGTLHLPAVSEPALSWTTSGQVDFQEREGKRPWITHRIKKGSFFLTTGGAPYDCRWKAVTNEPFETMSVFIELPILQRAFEEVFGDKAPHLRLRDVSAFTDPTLNSLMEQVKSELMRREASALLLGGIARAVAVHLARTYTEVIENPARRSPSLPGFKLQQITEWMAENLAEDFNLDRLSEQAGLSRFYFNRLFKSAMGVSPSTYFITLRINEAKRLLRETERSVEDIGFDVGYSTPSHFAQLFRKATGLTPRDYRRKR